MSEFTLDYGTVPMVPRPIVKAGRSSALRFSWSSAAEHWLSVRTLRSSIAHLDDRLLADAGFSQRDLGFAERFVRGAVAGGSIWARTDA
jgi:uncharacterized protein YjiS (DUF1127 family)